MSRVTGVFQHLKHEGRSALVVFITVGDPSLEATAELAPAIATAGADLIELGIPFSDPLADGPIIQAASQRSLSAGCSVSGVLECARKIRAQCDVPLVFMTSYNPVLQFGLKHFAAASAEAGVDGVLVSDLPPHESDTWISAARERALDTVFLVAPTSPPQRIKAACRLSTGFVYCVSRTGVTGVREHLPPDLVSLVERTRPFTERPIGVGFGISKPEHVGAVTAIADAAIVGSAVVRIIGDEQPWPQRAERVTDFVAELAGAKAGAAAQDGAH